MCGCRSEFSFEDETERAEKEAAMGRAENAQGEIRGPQSWLGRGCLGKPWLHRAIYRGTPLYTTQAWASEAMLYKVYFFPHHDRWLHFPERLRKSVRGQRHIHGVFQETPFSRSTQWFHHSFSTHGCQHIWDPVGCSESRSEFHFQL